ncbi:MAG TPA: aldose 1-epimerase [Casimicrobiaceae bacterium]|nr:aldose 1-epimerase [Casimicrobiaceae bacterium]
MSETLLLAESDARVELAPATGGAIARFAFADVDVLRPASAEARATGNVRGYACYPLVPYSNRIANAQLSWGGRNYALARNFGEHPHSIHGVGWQRPWRVAAHDAASALLAFEHTASEADARAWPWPFRATQRFTLAVDDGVAALSARITIANSGTEAFPFGLGFHPFLPRSASTELGFSADRVWKTDGTQLPMTEIAIPDAWQCDPPCAVDAVTLDNVFTGWRGGATLVDRTRRLATTIAADRAASFLVVYVPPARDFLAVEPVTHMTDAFNRAARGERGTGTRMLAAGAAFSCTMRISARLLP